MSQAGIATTAAKIPLEGLFGTPDTRVPFLFVDPSSTGFWENARERLQRAEYASRLSAAKAFADHVRDDPRVQELWYDDAREDATLTLIVESATLEEELFFEAALAAVLAQRSEPFHGFLRVYSTAPGVPSHAREGVPLLP